MSGGNGKEPTLLLDVDGIVAGFGSNTVLHGCSYSVREGEIAAVLGLNGAGKSVSAKVVAGIVPARGGAIRFRGADVTRIPAELRVAAGMGHVPQGRQVFPGMTVEQNLRLGAYVQRRRDRARYPAVLDSVLERFPVLASRRAQAAGTMSGGEQAMLAVARALMSEPVLLIVDEASAGLAPKAVESLFETLVEVHRSGVSILMIEQNVTFTLQVADRVHVMQTGRVVYEGAVGDLDQNRVAEELGVGRLLGGSIARAAAGRKTSANGKARSRPKAAAKRTGS